MINTKLKNKFFPILSVLLILIVAAYFRFANFTNRISMGADSARDAFVSLEGAKYLQFPTTGPFISIAPVTTGPWYWIQLILIRMVLPTNYAPWILLGIYSTGFVLIMYFLGKLLGGHRLGLLSALVCALSVNQIDNSVQLSNPSVIGFYSGLFILLFIILLRNPKRVRLSYLTGIILGVTINTHYQTFGLLSLPLLLLFYGKKYLAVLRRIFIALILTFLPLLWFELTNNWFNTHYMMQYLLYDQYRIWTSMSWKIYVKDFWPNFFTHIFGFNFIASRIILLLVGFTGLLTVFKKRLGREYILLLVSFAIQVVIIRYYRGERYFGYLQFFHPYLFLFVGLLIEQFFLLPMGKILGIIAVIFYMVMVFPESSSRINNSSFTMEMKELVTGMVPSLGPGPYKIYKCQNTFLDRIQGLVLELEREGKYSSSGKPLIYDWGCGLPSVRLNGTVIPESDLKTHADSIYLRFDYLRDVSIASPAGMMAIGWKEASPKSMYQSAARWWMDEQP